LIKGDISKERNCINAVKEVVKQYGRIDVLVNNAALHYENKSLETITSRELIKTFETNISSYFWITKSTLPHMKKIAALSILPR